MNTVSKMQQNEIALNMQVCIHEKMLIYIWNWHLAKYKKWGIWELDMRRWLYLIWSKGIIFFMYHTKNMHIQFNSTPLVSHTHAIIIACRMHCISISKLDYNNYVWIIDLVKRIFFSITEFNISHNIKNRYILNRQCKKRGEGVTILIY